MPPWDKYAQTSDPVIAPADPYKQAGEIRAQQDQQLQFEAAARARESASREAERLRIAQEAEARASQKQQIEMEDRQTGRGATESERKAAAFLLRALGANDSYEATGLGPRGYFEQKARDYAPDAMNTIGLNSPDRQVADSAQDEFIAASLRQDSGAAIPPEELERQRRIYFPMPGDGPEAIAQKRAARQRAIEGLKQSSGALLNPTMERFGSLSGAPSDQQDGFTRDEVAGGLTGSVTDETPNMPNSPDGTTPPDGDGYWSQVGQRLAQGAGSVVEGIANIPGIVVDPLATTLGRALGYENYTSDFGARVRQDLGFPENPDHFANAVIGGGAAALGGAGLARGAASVVGSAPVRNALAQFAATPIRDAAAGAGAGAGGYVGEQIGGVPGAVAGSLAGGLAGYGGANALARQVVGERAPNAMMQSADQFDVTMLPADVGGVGTRMASGAVGRTLGGIPIAEGAEKAVASAGQARNRIASGIGDAADEAGAGQAARRGFKEFTKSSKARSDELYEQVSVPAESKVQLANTRAALTEVTRGMQSNPQLSKLWANHPHLRATLEALTPNDTRPAGQVQLTQASDSLKGAEEALTRAKEEAARNLSFEQSQARDAVEQARKAFDDALTKSREEAVAAQRQYDALRPQVVGSDKLVQARQNADAAQARFQAFSNRDRNAPEVAQALKSIDDAEASFRSLRFREPTSDAVTKAQEAVTAAKNTQDEAFILSRQMPQGGELSWQDMNRFRSIVGEVIGQPGIARDGSDIAALRKLYGALSTDMEVTAAQAGPKALQQFNRATQYWRGRETRIEDVFQTLFGNRDQKSDEAVFRQINSWAQSRTGDFSRLARTIRTMPEDEANTVRATVIERMGQAKAAKNNTTGEVFSPVEFSTQWNSLSSRAKSVLFPNKQHRQDLDSFAKLMEGMKRATEYQNFSNTSLGVNLTAQGALAFTNLPVAAALAAVQFGAGKLLASPRFARLIASTSKMPPEVGARKLSEQLEVLATREPLLATDARALQQYLTESLGQSPVRAAASEQETDGRREPVQ